MATANPEITRFVRQREILLYKLFSKRQRGKCTVVVESVDLRITPSTDSRY